MNIDAGTKEQFRNERLYYSSLFLGLDIIGSSGFLAFSNVSWVSLFLLFSLLEHNLVISTQDRQKWILMLGRRNDIVEHNIILWFRYYWQFQFPSFLKCVLDLHLSLFPVKLKFNSVFGYLHIWVIGFNGLVIAARCTATF